MSWEWIVRRVTGLLSDGRESRHGHGHRKEDEELCWTTCVRDTVSDIRKAHQTNFYKCTCIHTSRRTKRVHHSSSSICWTIYCVARYVFHTSVSS